MSDTSLESGRQRARKMGLHKNERLIVMCVDRKTSKCASSKQMANSWKHLKKRLKESGLSSRGRVVRIKSQCIGICKGGPLMAVYPEGTWYGNCTPQVIDEIIESHFINGKIVDKYVISQSQVLDRS